MTPAVRRKCCLVLLAMSSLVVVGAVGARQEQDFEVPRAGRVAIPLTPVQLVHHAARELIIFGPDGAPIGFHVEHESTASERRKVRLSDVQETEDGWSLILDLGPSVPLHTRLHFRLAAAPVVARVQVAVGTDGTTFQALGSTSLFQIGGTAELRSTAIDYPVTGARWIRLSWPRSAGLPESDGIEVECVVRELAIEPVSARVRDPGVSGGVRVYFHVDRHRALNHYRRLDVELESASDREDIGFRLAVATAGEFATVATGVRQRGTSSILVPLERWSNQEAWFRLDLWGAQPSKAHLLYSRPFAVFSAPESGSHALVWGAGPSHSQPSDPPASDDPPTWLEIGHDDDSPASSRTLSTEPFGLAGPAPDGAVKAWWPVRVEAGEQRFVRLELPAEVYRHARPDLADLRLIVGDRQVPFVLESEALPETEISRRRVGLITDETQNRGTLRLSSAEAQIPWTQFEVTSKEGPFERDVSLTIVPEPGRRHESSTALPRADRMWRCDRSTEPCLLSLELERFRPRSVGVQGEQAALTFELTVDHGDNAPLEHLDVDLHRRRDILMFAVPNEFEEDLVLTTGSTQSSPFYDLFAVADQIALQPLRTADLGPLSIEGGDPEWARTFLTITIALAAAFLLSMLVRMLKSLPGSDSANSRSD